jgi:hypothetical protein
MNALPALALSLSVPLIAGGAARFAALRGSAEPVGSLGAFLDRYVAECPRGSLPQCRSNGIAFRTRSTGKRFVLALNEEAAGLLSVGRFDSTRKEYELLLTPFFAAGPYALTHGAPRHTDAGGNPLLPQIAMRQKAPEDWDSYRVQRLIAGRELRVEVIFTPEEVWTLPRKRGEAMRGVKSRIEALQVINGRTGDVLAAWP